MQSSTRIAFSLVLFSLSAAIGGAQPKLSQGGIVNGASFLPPAVPGAGIAQGSFFTGFGEGIGPSAGISATALPLPTELEGVRVTVTAGGTTYNAFLNFVFASQFNAVMPSEVPVGPVEIRVIYNGQTSEPVTATVVKSSFGIFSATSSGSGPGIVTNFVSQTEQPLNASSVTAAPGQIVTIWGTGLLGFPGKDAISPLEADIVRDLQGMLNVKVFVAGQPVQRILYAGRSAQFPAIDQISVELADSTPAGCFVPVVVASDGNPSNEVTIAVGDGSGPCEDPLNPLSSALIDGAKLGLLANARVQGRIALGPSSNVSFTLDVFAGSFNEQTGAPFSYNRFFSLPPLGSCSRQVVRNLDLLGLLGGELPNLSFGEELDAGPSLSITRNGADEKEIAQDPESIGRYVDTVGGGLALIGTPPPTYYDPGQYRIQGQGGSQVGPIDFTFTLPERPEWINRDAVVNGAPVNRAAPLNIAWTPGDAANPQIMVALAANVDIASGAASGVVCVMPQSAGGVTIPTELMMAIPASKPPGQLGLTTLGFLGFGSLPVIEPFQAQGLDLGVALGATVEMQSVTFQ